MPAFLLQIRNLAGIIRRETRRLREECHLHDGIQCIPGFSVETRSGDKHAAQIVRDGFIGIIANHF
ncbi:MAG TPA: hypothetical protein DCF88_07675, partial [Plesiomonas shigelloides]|nr:hypothetical protein [Plesiomonas shigelloides]